FRSFDLASYDLVLVSTHAFSKAIRPVPRQVRVAYCYTPIRYLWGDLKEEYRATLPPIKRLALDLMAPGLCRADLSAAKNMSAFIAISAEVQRRITRFYQRDSEVLAPPVFTDQWTPVDSPSRDYFLIVSRFVPYKRVDIAVAACARLGLKLKVVGTGPEESRVRDAALVEGKPSPHVEFLGFVEEAALRELYANATALLFTAHEDFGLAPLEANACGTPVIAYGAGGALETVVDGETGLFFREQTVDSLTEALKRFEPAAFAPATLRAHAETYATPLFTERLLALLEAELQRPHDP
ncbi:MAG: glycosyltransferase, partial [bacterium]